MTESSKGRSPFFPGQPVPAELFVGRSAQIERIMNRGVGQVAEGKPAAIFIQGEYGIGKSSVASFVQWRAERERRLLPIYVSLGGCKNLEDVARCVLEGAVRSGVFDSRGSEKIRNWLARYVVQQELFGLSINLAAIAQDAPRLATPFGLLSFLAEAYSRWKEDGGKGIFLVLDEINGITGNPDFAHLLKGLVDTNAVSQSRLPLLLMLCGVEDRRREMIRCHEPVDRIFEIVPIELLGKEEMAGFFSKAFESVHMSVDPEAMETLVSYSAGFPKIMHLIGDSAYWMDQDGRIDDDEALNAVFDAAEEVGRKYVDQQVYGALRSDDYHSILKKMAKLGPRSFQRFFKKDIEGELNDTEKRELNNFLQRMKKLHVLRPGEVRGEYVFTMRMAGFYMWLKSGRKAG